ncbi:hypothetical protein BGZ63DRAFT_420078 [Mariannaea sp. PMI_226]|nr:hypothetical protein BGZ63DRAFT_420078 [Mariannaea sp. PMI_226]
MAMATTIETISNTTKAEEPRQNEPEPTPPPAVPHPKDPQDIMTEYRSLETSRLEIAIIAAGIFILVSVMGIFILLAVGLRFPAGCRIVENGQRRTPWGAMYTQHQRRITAPYRDYHDDAFVSSFRRRSWSLAEEIKNELGNLTYNFTTGMGSWSVGQQQEEASIFDTLRKFGIDKMLPAAQRHRSNQNTCGSCSEFLDSPTSVTGREEEQHGAQIRLISNGAQEIE